MQNIAINVPYLKRHLIIEIKNHGGKFDSENKNWTLEDKPENRALKELVERRTGGPSSKERIANITTLAVDLLNGLKLRHYKITEVGDRIILDSSPLIAAPTTPLAPGVVVEIKSTPVVNLSETLVAS